MHTRLIGTLILGIGGLAILLNLGFWQVRRLEWKNAVLADIDARMGAQPAAVPIQADPETDRFRPVEATGLFTPDEIRVLVSVKGIGAAYRIVSRFETGERAILVDRGFVPDGQQDNPRPEALATIAGNLHWPDERYWDTPANDVVNNIWFARDVPQMAEVLDAEPILVILSTTSEADPAVTPLPLDTSGIPNDHFEYAVTWFSLAAVWAGMTVFALWRIRRRVD
ncbi:MAG: SURF1 family protein [Pseudomonadota bacterium]